MASQTLPEPADLLQAVDWGLRSRKSQLDVQARIAYRLLLAQYRLECRQAAIDVHIIAAGSHEANTPLLSSKLTQTGTDFEVELV